MSRPVIQGILLDEQVTISLTEICQACSCRSEWVADLVSEGILEPLGAENDEWLFSGTSLSTAQAAQRLQRDLGVNIAGVALVLELLDDIKSLRAQLLRQ